VAGADPPIAYDSPMTERPSAQRIASIVRRVEASVTTAVPAAVVWFITLWIMGSLLPVERYLQTRGLSSKGADLFVTIVAALVPVMWIAVDGSILRATYGMRKRGLFFAGLSGESIGWPRCLLRNVIGIVMLPAAPVSLVLMLLDERGRGLADRVCRTTIRSRPGIS
jgi:hypothetical protein